MKFRDAQETLPSETWERGEVPPHCVAAGVIAPSVAFGAEAFASLSVIGNLSGIRSGYDGG